MEENAALLPGRMGFGTWKILKEEEMETALSAAVVHGFRLIDTASIYKNEAIVGRVLEKLPVKREELFIQGKVWNRDRGYEKTLRAFDKTMEKLKLSYLDCYMIHWPATPMFDPEWEKTNAETYRAIERLVDEGAVKEAGLCNFAVEPLQALNKTANRKPAADQIELHPGCLQEEITRYCEEEGIRVEAWSPLGNGELLNHPVLLSMAQKYGISPAKLSLIWAENHGFYPIVKSVTPERIKENITEVQITMEEEDRKQLDLLPPGGKV